MDGALIATARCTYLDNRFPLRARPEQPIATEGNLTVHVIGDLVVDWDQHPVQIGTTGIGKIVSTVERDIQIVLRVGLQNEFRGGPCAKVVGSGEADGAAVCAFL